MTTAALTLPAEPASGGGLRRAASRAGRDLAYLTIAGLTSILAFAVWVTGVSVSLSLAVFIVGLPVALGSAIVFRWTAELDRRNAALEGGVIAGVYRDQSGKSFWPRFKGTLGDPQTWKDLAWLIVHSVLGFAFGVAAVTLVGVVAGALTLPAWGWSLPDGADLGIANADTLGEHALVALAAIPAIPLVALLLRGMAALHSAIARALL
jgi:hypothetical protein